MAFTPEDESNWDYTRALTELHGETYRETGKELIGRDMDPRGRIWYTNGALEAISVEPRFVEQNNNQTYNEWSADIETKALNGVDPKTISESEKIEIMRSNFLNAAFETVTERMPYSKEGVDKTLSRWIHSQGSVVELSNIMMDGSGVCRHQALALATLLYEGKDKGYFRGNISIDRSEQWSPTGDIGGHAWVRYTTFSGEVIILDVAQGFIGTLKDSKSRVEGWNYYRPADKAAEEAQKLGQSSMRGTGVEPIVDIPPQPEPHPGLITGVPDHLKYQPAQEDDGLIRVPDHLKLR